MKKKKNENTMIQNLRSKSNAKRETYSNKSLSQRKISNKLPNLTPKETRKKGTTKYKDSKKEEITYKDQNRYKGETNKQKVQ